MQQASSDGLFDYLRSGSTTRLRQCLEAPEVFVDVAALDNTAHTALPNNNDRNKTFLHYAAEVGDATTVSLLLQQGAAVNATTADGRTSLYLAAYAGQPEAVRALIQGGANVNQAERCSWTPLHRAAQKGHLECVVALLGAGADVNAVTGKNVTPLHLACEKAKAEIAVTLLQHGADRTIVDRDGKTPQRSVKKWGESKLAHVWSTQVQRPTPQARPAAHHAGQPPAPPAHDVTGGALNPGQHGSAGSAQHPHHQQQHQARHSQQQVQHHEQSQQQRMQHQASTDPELQLQRELELHERLAQERAQGGEYHHSHTGAVEQVRPQQLQEPYPQQPYPRGRDSERSPGAVAGVSAHEAPAPRNPQLVLLQNQSEEDYLRMVAKAAPVAADDASAPSPLPLRHSQPPVAQSQSQYQSQYQPAPLQPQSSGSTSQPGRSTTKSADFDAIVVGRPGSDDDDDSGSPFPSQRPRSGGALTGPDSRGRQSAPAFQTLPGGLVVGRATSSTTSTSSAAWNVADVHGRTQRQSESSQRRENFNEIVVGRPGSDDDFDGVAPHRSSVPQARGDRRGQLLPEPQRVPTNQHREMSHGLVARSADTLERASDHVRFSSARSAQPTRHGSSASPPDQQFNDIVVGRPGSDDDFDGVAPQRSSVPRAPGPPAPPPPRGPTVAHPASPNRLFNDTAQLLPEPQRVPSNQHREMPHGLVARSADTLERASDHAKGFAERAARPGYQPPRHGNRPASSPDQFNDIVVGRPASDSDDDRTSSGQTQARATGSLGRGQLLPEPQRVPTNQHREMPDGLVARSADTLERASDHAKGFASAERAARSAYQPSSSSHDIDGRAQRPGRQETTAASSGPGTFRHGRESPVTQSSDVTCPGDLEEDRSHRALPPDQRLAKAWAGIDSAQPARESLHRAVRDGDLGGVKRLLENGANPLLAEATDTYGDGESAIETAYAVKNIGALRMMLAVLKHDPPKATPRIANMSSLMTSQQSSAAPSVHGNAVDHAHNNPRTQAQARSLAGSLPANESEVSSIPTLSAGPSATPSSAHGGRW